jgi:hypothetical protein
MGEMQDRLDDDSKASTNGRSREIQSAPDADDYIQSLIQRDIDSDEEAWNWLTSELSPDMMADEREFASADIVIGRNRQAWR